MSALGFEGDVDAASTTVRSHRRRVPRQGELDRPAIRPERGAVRSHPLAVPRKAETDWPTTCLGRAQAWRLLNSAPLMPPKADTRHPHAYPTGVRLLLDWLADHPGLTWQDRWIATGADAGGRSWRQIPARWLREHSQPKEPQQYWLFRALLAAIAGDLIRPALTWLVTANFRRGTLLNIMSQYRDPDGFTRLKALRAADSDIHAAAANRTAYRAVLILAATGGALADITPGDVLALFDAEADTHATSVGATHLFYRVLHALGGFGAEAPATLRELRAAGQRGPQQLIDRYELARQPIRDLLVDYLRERQPALDYTSLDALAYYLGGLFWSDLKRHHPGISSLHLPTEAAQAWKQRLRTVTRVAAPTVRPYGPPPSGSTTASA